MKTLLGSLLLTLPVTAAPSAMGPGIGSEVEVETISFASKDGLEVTADHYRSPAKDAPLIVLFHQAGWSRGEYGEIAPRLVAMGYDCLAVDLRSGGEINEVVNETNRRAKAAGKKTAFVDAEQDVLAALTFARGELKGERLLAWGSSYSAALVLRVAARHEGLVDACVSFAPGEYFQRDGKPGDWIESSVNTLTCPVFVTSAGHEQGNWAAMFAAIPGEKKQSFLPKTKGQHGSRALWRRFEDSGAYWAEVEPYLAQHFPARAIAATSRPTSRPARRENG
jgi:dienelactone hydrolase